MLLKNLDTIGFKSFAERTTIDFVPGVTAVVGPNGSGKSNVIDAIRWVLGETSAKSLRGSKMEDIIFSGSDSRKPLNFAEVTITFDNSDNYLKTEFQEVSVTRRVYRSGDSEYQINKQSCRLKDIVDLFMDTGLGKEAFSIIGQGKIDSILNSKPEERRTIFEEAAGVLKYKTRKKKAVGKLEETRLNLSRVNDIIRELDAQINPLKEQAIIAEDYLIKKSELKQFEVGFLAYEIEELNERYNQLAGRISSNEEIERELSVVITTKNAELEQLRANKILLDEKISNLHDKFTAVTEEFERLEKVKAVNEVELKNASQNKSKLAEEISLITEEIQGTEMNLQEKNELINAIKSELKALKETLKQTQLLTEGGPLYQIEIDSMQGELIELLNKQAQLRHESEMLTAQIAHQNMKQGQFSSDDRKLKREKEAIESQIAEIESQITDVTNDISKQIDEYRQAFAEFSRNKETLAKNQERRSEVTLQLQRLTSRKEALEALEDDFQGFFQGVREILKAKSGRLNGIEGAMAELINVPKKYTMAIEIALGAGLQNIVVTEEAAARSAIEFLKQNRLGRATFLPMSTMKARTIPAHAIENAKRSGSYIGIASELVHFDSKYSGIVSNQLGSVMIATDLKGANEIARATEFRFRIVTLEGDVVNPGGAMTGGANKSTGGSLLSRKNELEEIAPKIVALESEISSLSEEIVSITEVVNEAELNVSKLREAGENRRLEESVLIGKLESAKVSEKNISDRMLIFEMDHSSWKEESESKASRLIEVNASLETIKIEVAQLEKKITTLIEQKESASQDKDAQLQIISNLNVEVARKNEQISHHKAEVDRLTSELENKSSSVTHKRSQVNQIDELLNVSNNQAVLDADSNAKLEEKNALTEELSKERGIRTQMQIVEDDLDVALKELQRQHRGITSALQTERIKFERSDADMENRITKLRDEYELSFEAAKEGFALTIAPEDAKRKIKLINIALNELGVVNIGAIEEHARVSERYNYLTEQRVDLEGAREKLLEVIFEMDDEMVKRFKESFTQIQREFHDVYPILFGGGHAELRLTDPNDFLNTGIDIVAQPPGKKLQHLSLLSGGERALTAIALLFAILRVRPIPFCILDEVEAALDDVNVHRFSSYLRHFSKTTQFIVITHRKGTMEEADVLYGVTMQESGVSRLVSVRLEEAEEIIVEG